MSLYNTDLVALKAALRQLLDRLEVEEKATKQWCSLAENRGLEGVARQLARVAAAIEGVQGSLGSAIESVVKAQEEETAEHAKMHEKGIPHQH